MFKYGFLVYLSRWNWDNTGHIHSKLVDLVVSCFDPQSSSVNKVISTRVLTYLLFINHYYNHYRYHDYEPVHPAPVTLCTQYVPGTGLLYYWDRNKERRLRARELLACKSGGGRGEIRGRDRTWLPSGSCLPAFQVEQKGEQKGEENKGDK